MPNLNPDQTPLLLERDVVVNRELVGPWPLKLSPAYVTNGRWALLRDRVANQQIFACDDCLYRATRCRRWEHIENPVLPTMYRQHADTPRYERTSAIVFAHGLDFVRFESRNSRVYVQRIWADRFGFEALYGHTVEALWDAPRYDEATLCVAAGNEPSFARLPFEAAPARVDPGQGGRPGGPPPWFGLSERPTAQEAPPVVQAHELAQDESGLLPELRTFRLPDRPRRVMAAPLSETLFMRLFTSAEQATNESTSWKAHRIGGRRVVPLVALGSRGEVLALPVLTEAAARRIDGAIQPLPNESGWLNDHSPVIVYGSGDVDDATRDWTLTVGGADIKAVFIPYWRPTEHYIAIFPTPDVCLTRLVDSSRLAAHDNESVKVLLEEVALEVLQGA